MSWPQHLLLKRGKGKERKRQNGQEWGVVIVSFPNTQAMKKEKMPRVKEAIFFITPAEHEVGVGT